MDRACAFPWLTLASCTIYWFSRVCYAGMPSRHIAIDMSPRKADTISNNARNNSDASSGGVRTLIASEVAIGACFYTSTSTTRHSQLDYALLHDIPLQHMASSVLRVGPFATQHQTWSQETLVDTLPTLRDLAFLKLLGTGGSSHVYLARQLPTQRTVAVKVIKKHGRSKTRSGVLRERHIQAAICPSFFAPLLASFHDTANFYLVMVRGSVALVGCD